MSDVKSPFEGCVKRPSAAKATLNFGSYGAAEAVPLPKNRSYHTDSKGPTLEKNPRGHDVSCPYTSKPRTNREVGHYKTTLLQGLGAAME